MSDASNLARNIRDRVTGTTEERLGRALSDLLENPLLTGAIGRAFEAREKATQAQEVALGAFNIPSAADIERLTRRLRSVSHRLEGIEDGVERLDRALAPARGGGSDIEQRLTAIEQRLGALTEKLAQESKPAAARMKAPGGAKATAAAGKAPGRTKAAAARTKAPGRTKPAAARTKAPARAKRSGAAKAKKA